MEGLAEFPIVFEIATQQRLVQKLDVEILFIPFPSQDKGTIENGIGVLR